MRRLIAGALVVLTVGFGSTGAKQAGWNEPLLRVRIDGSGQPNLRATLEASGYDVLSSESDDAVIDVVVSRADLDRLEKSGLKVIHQEAGRPLRQIQATNVPGDYLDLDGVIIRMYEIAAAHPDIAQVVDLTELYNTPSTFEGRHLLALKISDNVAADEDEPAMLVVSNHHAREIVAPVIAIYAAEQFTDGYGTDVRITSAVDDYEIWIAPTWNPDGYHHVFTVDNLWRKNRRIFATGIGVDQNRNYPQGWDAPCAGSTSVNSETYKGPAPASEAETETMIVWSIDRRFAKVLDYHSTGREVVYGYRCLSHPFTSWMQQEAAAISFASDYNGARRLPSAEGEHQEWQFAQMGAYAFLIETHSQFQPSYDSALNEAVRVWPGILSVIERPVSMSGHVTDAVTGNPVAAQIELLDVTFSNGERYDSGGLYGRFHMFLPPGTYNVRFSAEGYTREDRSVTVTESSATVLDVPLSPVEILAARRH